MPPTYSKNVIKNSDQKNNIPIPVTIRTALSINADAKKNENGKPNVMNTIMANTIKLIIPFITNSLYIYSLVIASAIALTIITHTQLKNPPATIKPIDNIIKANVSRTIESDENAKTENTTTNNTIIKPIKYNHIANSFYLASASRTIFTIAIQNTMEEIAPIAPARLNKTALPVKTAIGKTNTKMMIPIINVVIAVFFIFITP